METLDAEAARRLALLRAGLLKPDWTGLPRRAAGRGRAAGAAAHDVIRRFGYLQLDSIPIVGARSQSLVLHSRLDFPPERTEELLRPGEPLFEYWGHAASWIPMELYPVFEHRRHELRSHRGTKRWLREYPKVARELRARIRDEGPLRSLDLEGRGSRGWWDKKPASRIAAALWTVGDLAVRERKSFHRTYDLPERVIPERWRRARMSRAEASDTLVRRALEGHGWATTGTLVQTFRPPNLRRDVVASLRRLERSGEVVACEVVGSDGERAGGWVRPGDLELASRAARLRPRRDDGVLLSPFDPVLWDRARARQLFGFDQVLEIYKPAAHRKFGYYCLPVLAGENLVARVDLKAERSAGRLHVLSCHFEESGKAQQANAADRAAVDSALKRWAGALSLELVGWR